MTATLIDRLPGRAMALAIDAFDDDDMAMAQLRDLADGDDQTLSRRSESASPSPPASPPATAP
jgi:hypothetical protein